jgi:signal transduction histidine kinase
MMLRQRKLISEKRAQTDASLGAERANRDSSRVMKSAKAQTAQHDLLEHERMAADARLWKYRSRVDSLLARGRPASPELDKAMASERHVADEDRRIEREVTDACLQREHAGANDFGESADEAGGLEAHRHDTDELLTTERKGADSALDATTKALAEAKSAEEHQSDLLGMVAHDLRNPLSIIGLGAQMIVETTAEAATREDAQEVARAASRMERLLLDLLDVARIESRTLRIARADHGVCGFVTEVFRSYEPLFAAREITFRVESPGSDIVASFDHDRIVQVMSNLLGNALKFTPVAGTVQLRVERRGPEVEFVLRDSGLGIHPDALPHVFKRFWQTDSDARRGLGLGLYISEKIVQAHGGRIWVESTLGKGTTFHFTLPVASPIPRMVPVMGGEVSLPERLELSLPRMPVADGGSALLAGRFRRPLVLIGALVSGAFIAVALAFAVS